MRLPRPVTTPTTRASSPRPRPWAEAFDDYDEVLFEATEVATPLAVYGDKDDFDDDDDEVVDPRAAVEENTVYAGLDDEDVDFDELPTTTPTMRTTTKTRRRRRRGRARLSRLRPKRRPRRRGLGPEGRSPHCPAPSAVSQRPSTHEHGAHPRVSRAPSKRDLRRQDVQPTCGRDDRIGDRDRPLVEVALQEPWEDPGCGPGLRRYAAPILPGEDARPLGAPGQHPEAQRLRSRQHLVLCVAVQQQVSISLATNGIEPTPTAKSACGLPARVVGDPDVASATGRHGILQGSERLL